MQHTQKGHPMHPPFSVHWAPKRSLAFQTQFEDLRLKTMFRAVALLLSGGIFFFSTPAFASPVLQTLLVATSQGQFFQKQPKEDPFKPAADSIDRLMQEKRQQAREHLRQARYGLAQGNSQVAKFHYNRVVALEVKFSADEDSPEKLLADINQFEKRTNNNAL
ncbi:MAG: hypothetical protein VX970_07825, partial [Planctomycetota bacterium]|nr:hypothetical protein [Planctomycetota bacterium]